MDMYDETLILLDRAIGRIPRGEIAKGSKVDVNWLNKFAARQISDPGVRKVERVRDFLFEKIGLVMEDSSVEG
jgi:hypothetical protein